MKNLFTKMMPLSLVLCCVTVLFSFTADAKTTLRYATENSTAAWFHPNYYVKWADKVKEVTDGRVEVKIYPAGSLGHTPAFYDMIQNGIADLAFGVQIVNAGQFPLTEIANLPFLNYPSGEAASEILWKLYEKYPEIQKEYQGFKLLQLGMTDQYQIVTTTKEVKGIEDLKGLKLRVAGARPAEATTLLGAVPVSIRMGELYVSMEKGIIDGVTIPGEPVLGQVPVDKLRYALKANLWTASFWVAVNENTWNRISPEDQKLIWESCGGIAGSKWIGQAFDEARKSADAVLTEKGCKINRLPSDESAQWLAMAKGIHEKYLNSLEKKGLPAKAVYEDLLKMIAEYSE